MPHIHGVLWIDPDWLQKRRVTGTLADHPEIAKEVADAFMSCNVPSDNPELKNTVTMVQKHKHTKSCLKRGKGCRYGFPKLPVPETVIAQPLTGDTEDDKKTLEKAKSVISKAINILEDPYT